MYKPFVFLLCFFVLAKAGAQSQQSGWLASFNTFKINNRFSLHLDVQLRSTDDWERVQAILLRPGLNYHLTQKLTLTAGYALIPNRQTAGDVSDLLAEHRIWEQALYTHRWLRATVAHRLRFEQRFLPMASVRNNEFDVQHHNKAYRLRYFIRNVVPLAKETPFSKGWFFALQDEVFGNVGDKSAVNGRFFDQNRLYGALGYRFPRKIDAEVGYMHQHIRTRASHLNNHILQLAVYKRL